MNINWDGKDDSVVYCSKVYGFGIFFPPTEIDCIRATNDSKYLFDAFFESKTKNIKENLSGEVVMTGLDERPFPYTWMRYKDVSHLFPEG